MLSSASTHAHLTLPPPFGDGDAPIPCLVVPYGGRFRAFSVAAWRRVDRDSIDTATHDKRTITARKRWSHVKDNQPCAVNGSSSRGGLTLTARKVYPE